MARSKKERIIMSNAVNDLASYRKFLESIPLAKYRGELKDIKWVEQDLPKEMLPLASIFRYYWNKRKYLDFEEWFETFWGELNANSESKQVLKQFKKYYFDKNGNGWFKAGFKARMYRTWVSVLTQLDFCYVFEYICAKEGKNLQLEANAELDRKGIDAKVGDIGFQVAKISQRKEARTGHKKKKVVTIPYAVFRIDEFKRKSESSRVKPKDRIGYKKAIASFYKYFILLKNGFVVFNESYLKRIIDNIDDIEKVNSAVEQIALELSGE